MVEALGRLRNNKSDLLGNVLRNTVLVCAQASGTPLPAWGHDAVGLLVLAAVCGGIAWAMGRTGTLERATS